MTDITEKFTKFKEAGNMQMSMRWFGNDADSISLSQIRQIPGVRGVITSLAKIPAGIAWTEEEVKERKKEIEDSGLKLLGIESINVHEDIKLGAKTKDELIDNYIKSLEAVGKADIHMVCYNFMPVFDWTRTDLAYRLPDGSTAMAYDGKQINGISAAEMFERIEKNSNGFIMPGWEPERKPEIMSLFDKYNGMTGNDIRRNYKYFLDAVMPTCEKYKIKMAVHPDDPSMCIFGLPRIVSNENDLLMVAKMNKSVYNGFTFCTGSLGSNRTNDLVKIIRNPLIGGRIHFAHIRNIKYESEFFFHESAHFSSDGEFDIYEICKALYDMGFDGVIRPDHGRAIWGEKARPGYGLYDRALGAAYINGIWEAIEKNKLKE
jgi:mannonate dehydratase